jgi:hypothetical protein
MASLAYAMTEDLVVAERYKVRSEVMNGWVKLGNGTGGFTVGFLLYTIPCVMVGTMVARARHQVATKQGRWDPFSLEEEKHARGQSTSRHRTIQSRQHLS